MSHRWFHIPPDHDAVLRVVVFPYAGGSACSYSGRVRRAHPHLQTCFVHYPGRGTRLAEPPPRSLISLAEAVARATNELRPLPTAFLGHSMGGLVAFEAARSLEAAGGPSPVHLFASACAAPHVPREIPDPESSDDEMVAWLTHLGGTPEEVFADPELLELVLEPIRRDLALLRAYRVPPGHPVGCPITVLTGRDDSGVHVAAWREYTSGPLDHREFSGGHHYLDDMADDVLELVHGLVAP